MRVYIYIERERKRERKRERGSIIINHIYLHSGLEKKTEEIFLVYYS